jgi:LPXTG-site transpeptidase (sortase) family protein
VEHFQHSALKILRKLQKRLELVRPSILISLGIFLFLVGASNYYNDRILSFTKTPTEAKKELKGELPAKIIIPSINIDLAIDIGKIENGVWQISYDKPTFLDSSARPGTNGNIIIYGHNKKAIFGNLPYLSLGQKIFIKTTDNKIYTYVTYQKDFVGPDRVDLIAPTDKEELTIYTCWGLFDSQRVVIKANLKNN